MHAQILFTESLVTFQKVTLKSCSIFKNAALTMGLSVVNSVMPSLS